MGPEFLTSVEARTALETPQAVLSWAFNSNLLSPIENLPWLWDELELRRSSVRYPEDSTEGTGLLTEAYSATPSVSLADVTVEGLLEYYYSLFFKYTEHVSSPVSLDQNVERLGSTLRAVYPDERETVLSAVDGQSYGTDVFTSAGSTFWTDGILAGFILQIAEGGADDGYYRIVSVDSEIQVTLDSTLTLTTTNVDFNILTDHDKYWIGGIDFHRHATLWRWDSKTGLVDQRIDLDELLDLDEFVSAIAFVGTISATKYISFLTSKRYVRLAILDQLIYEPASTAATVSWLLSNMPPNYEVAGAFLDLSVFQGSDTVYVLDKVNRVIQLLAEATGVAGSTIVVSGLGEVLANEALSGLAPDYVSNEILIGHRNYIYSYDETALSPIGVDNVTKITYVRELLTTDLGFFQDPLTDSFYVCVVNDKIGRLRTYQVEVGRAYLWQQPYVADMNVVGLYNLDETAGNALDAGQYGNDAANNGMTYEATGRFSSGYQATAVTHNIDLTDSGGNTFIANFDDAEGTLELWFAATTAEDLTSGDRTLADIRVDANNLVRIAIVSGSLTFEYIAGGTAETIAAAHPSPDTDMHHYMISWSVADDEVKAFVDFTQFGATQTVLGVWAGAVATALIGHTSAAALGIYDDVRVSDIARVHSTQVQLYTDANKMHAYSGRDYTATYEDDDPLGFFYRDEFFTPKFMGGDFIIRNDYEPEKLYPQNKVIEGSEVIFRGPDPLPTLGHSGRLARMFGLYLDRIADSREQTLDFFDRYRADIESIPAIADYLGLPGLDSENWNVDKQRRFLRVMPLIMKRAARNVSYNSYARLLGFLVTDDHLQSRRRFDSVHYNANYDPYVQAIPFDTMGSLDTGDENFPLALLRWRFYQRSTRSLVGTTSIPATRLLTDVTAAFRDTCEIGSLIQINDPDDILDNGNYLVTAIYSDTVLKVDQDWPQGSTAGLTYTNNWEVPWPDPFTDYILERFVDHIAPVAMRVMHRDDSV